MSKHLKNYDYSKKDMENIDMKMNTRTNKLTVVIDLNKEIRDSSTGKSIILATTLGNKKIKEDLDNGDIFIGINCYRLKD